MSGFPDNVVIHQKKTFWVELKRTNGKPTPAQYKVGSDITAAGGNWLWMSSKESIDKFVDMLLDREVNLNKIRMKEDYEAL